MPDLVIEGFRLSLQQKHLWFLQQDQSVYVSQCAVQIENGSRADEIRAAFLAAAARYEILRTTYRCLPGMDVPVQVIGEEPSVSFRTIPLESSAFEEAVEAALREDREAAFDFERGPLARLSLLERGAHNVLLLTLPAICLDSESLQGLLREILLHRPGVALSEGADEEPVQYADFSEWQNGLLEEEQAGGEIRNYWDEASRRLPTFPFRRGGTPRTVREPRIRRIEIDPSLAAAAEEIARAHGVSLSVVLLAAWQALMARLTGETDFSMSVLVDGRSFEQLQGALGPFAKYLPVRCAGFEDLAFSETLEIWRVALQDARERQNLFSWDVEGRGKRMGYLPFAFDFCDWREMESGGLRLICQYSRSDRSELRLSCVRSLVGLRAEIHDNGVALDEPLASLLPARLTALLRSALVDPQRPLWALDVLGDEERRRVLVEWNATARELPLGAGLAKLFREQAVRTPTAPAVEWSGRMLTFHELDRRSDLLARQLLAVGVGPDSVVGLLLERGFGQLVALLGILKAGGAYLPLDPHQPAPRLCAMLEDAAAMAVVGDARFRSSVDGISMWLELAPDGGVPDEGHEGPPALGSGLDNLAYVIFTSGSTGRPKGVMVRQESVLNLAAALGARIYEGLGERLRVSLNAPFSFDASVKQWIQLLAGHCLVLVPEEIRPDGTELLSFLVSSGVEVLDCTPSQLHLLLDAGLEEARTSLRLLLVGGEAISPELWERLARWTQACCVNVYGPTECTVDTTIQPVGGAAAPALGRPLDNVRIYVMDPRFQPVPIGVAGELCIGGEGVARGYFGRPALTAEKFVPDPFVSAAGVRLYRSGDLARWNSEGLLEFLGRVDHQVKVRGYRIELGEIEASLRRHPGVEEAVVALHQDQPDRPRLVAYAVPRRRFARYIDGRMRRELPNGLAVVEQNRNETDYLYEEIFIKESYVRNHITLAPGSCVLDVGANIGMFTMFVRRRCPTAQIYAFEPIGPIYDTLRINCELYGPGTHLLPFGLSDQERTESFLYYPLYSMMSGQKEYARPEEEVAVIKRYLRNEGERASSLLSHAEELLAGRFEGEVWHSRLRRLSDVLAEESIERVDLLKVDVQRAELDVLRGIDDGDWPRIGQIVMEVHDARGGFTEGRVQQIADLLVSRGYSVTVEQDELLAGTDRYQLYALRPEWVTLGGVEETPVAEPAVLAQSDLREHLRQHLPDYMLPATILLLDQLPLTRNGKVDRAALPMPEEEDRTAREVARPRTPFEEMLAGIWVDVLGVPQVGVDESFFDLGGHSLLATQLVSRVREHFQVELSLRSFFEGPTLEQLALRVEEAVRSGKTPGLPLIRHAPRTEDLPLSFSQQRLWFLHQLDPENALYNNSQVLKIEGPLDLRVLRRVLTEIIRRHEVLRTVFRSIEGEPVQRILPPEPPLVCLIDLTVLPEALRNGELRRIFTGESRRPFDLTRGPLLRARVARLGEENHALLFVQHHIISDAWSLGILSREVAALYPAFSQGLPSPLEELPIQYADYACWQRAWLQGEILEAQLSYWRGRLEIELLPLSLPLDRARPMIPTFRGSGERFNLDPALCERLRGLGRREGATLFMVLLTVFQTLLYRYSGQAAVSIGTPIAGRSRLEIEGLIGFFVNTLVLRTDLSGDPSFRQALARLRGEALGAYAHQDLPFEKLVECLAPDRDLAISPLFQVMFSLQNVPVDNLEIPGLRLSPLPFETEWAPFDLTLVLSDVGSALSGELQYATELFEPATVQRLLRHLLTLLEGATTEPERSVSELPLLDPAERQQILEVWSGASAKAPQGPCLHQLFEIQAERLPQAPAIVTWQGTMSFRELNQAADRLARVLKSLGVGPEVRVALCLDRTPRMAVGILGTLKAGGAFVALDPSYPPERLRSMLVASGASVLLTSGQQTEVLSDAGARTVRLDAPLPEVEGPEPAFDPPPVEAAAYVIFTSGSTGIPKGVIAPHSAVASYTLEIARYFGLGPADRVLQFASPAFDVLIEELFPAWASGAAVVLERQEVLATIAGLARVIEGLGVTALELPSSYWREWVDELSATGECPPASLRLVILGSEKPSLDQLEVWQRFGVPTINIFGLTETTITSNLYRVPLGPLTGKDRVDLPVGPPVAIARVYIADSRFEPVPVGVVGELYIGGAGVARGYLGRPDLSAERFIPNPFGNSPGERLYHTGDLARFRADGALEFLGRIDDQIKIRGFRVEPGEVEAHLARHPVLCQAVVLSREDERGERRLVAYIVPEPGAVPPSSAELRSYLRALLPAHLVPSLFVPLDAIPLTPNGKIDRRALPAPRLEQEGSGAMFAAPATPIEEMLAAIWSEVLGVESPSRDGNFFDLGGHSILATRMVSRVCRVFQVELPLRTVFERPTLAALAAKLEDVLRNGETAEMPPIRRAPRERDLPLSFSQQRLWFFDQLEPGNPIYNVASAFRIEGPLVVPALDGALREVVRRHEVLRTRFESVDGRPVQRIDDGASTFLTRIDLSAVPSERIEHVVQVLAAEEARRPFDLARGPLIRTTVVCLGNQEHVALFTLHHIVSDEWSAEILIREVSTLYETLCCGLPLALPELPIQYADYAWWQRQWLQGAILDAELEYWRVRLREASQDLTLPTDRPRPPVRSFRGASVPVSLGPDLLRKLRGLGREEGSTLFITLLAAFQVLLARWCGQRDVCVGTPIAGRHRLETESLIGFFVNTLVLRTDLSVGRSFRELLGRTREVALGAYAHQDLPFERLVDELAPERELSRNPLFQVFFSMATVPTRIPEVSGLRLSPLQPGGPAAKLDLELALSDQKDRVQGLLVYSVDLFDVTTTIRLADRLRILLDAVASSPEIDVWALDLLSETERHQVVVEWSAMGKAGDLEPVQEVFARQALRRPDAPALEWEGERLSYGQLESSSNRLGRYLIEHGAGSEMAVGVLLERTPELVVALLAVLKVGAAYVPLDPELPRERLDLLIEEGGIALVVSREALVSGLPRRPRRLVLLDADAELIGSQVCEALGVRSRAGDLAYQIYTSGTTGRPKAVMVEHGSLSWLLWASRDRFGWSEMDRVLCLAPSSFDIFLFELLSPLLAGGTSVLFPIHPTPEVEHLVSELGRCTAVHAVPALLRQLVDEAIRRGGIAGLRAVFVGGDTVPLGLLEDLELAFPAATRWVLYGPTEGTILSTSHQIPVGAKPRPLLGRPLPGTIVEVMDSTGLPVPIGAVGEVWLGGTGVSRGYRGRPDLTAERYVPGPQTRKYRTGDLGRWLWDGHLEFLGRSDEQVKVRGFRIELGEVEAALRRCPGVREVVVAARQDGGNGKRLIAYLAKGEDLPEVEHLRQHLGQMLPEYMVPSAFVVVDELLLTVHGKVDRRRLPAPGTTVAPGAEVTPRTPAEEILSQIWSEVLGLQRIDVHQSFFSLGGDSILSIQVVAKARRRGLHLTAKQVFLYPTIAELARVAVPAADISGEQDAVVGEVPLTPIQRRFFSLGLANPSHFNQSLLFASREKLHPGSLAQAVARLVEHHDALRLRFQRRDGEWVQHHAGPGDVPFLHADLSALPSVCWPQAVEAAADEIQKSLDLAAGPILRFALFSPGAGERQRLLAVVHHLAVDGVSWRILLEDLETAYRQVSRGKEIVLPSKTCSFKEWSERLAAHARSGGLQAEAIGWLAVAEHISPLPIDFPGGGNRVGTAATIKISLSPEETRALLEDVSAAYRTRADEVLLTALAEPLTRLTGARSTIVEIEGHGRDALEGIDLSRTVGWLTAAFPVLIEGGGTPEEALKHVKESLRSVLFSGIGYGLLLDPASTTDAARRLQSLARPEVSFNYLGQLDRALPESFPFDPAPESKGENQDLQDLREHLLEISAAVIGGGLEVSWIYSRELHRRETIAALADQFLASLRRLIAHCLSSDAGGYTPSDFPLAGLGQRTLDLVLGAERGIEDVYPLSPLQQGMLFHTLSSPGSQAYFEQFSYCLRGELDTAAFRRAWQHVVDRHPILRSSFLWEGLREPMQMVHQKAALPWEELDWRGSADPQHLLEKHLAADRRRSFELARAPLMRLTLIRLDGDEWWLTWSHHHVLLDGWSLSIVFREVLVGYEVFRNGGKPSLPAVRPYRDYIEWLRRQDSNASERYWRGALRDFSAPTPLPGDRPATPGERGEADAELGDRLSACVTDRLVALARELGVTLHILVQAAWALLLARCSGERSVVFGSVVSGRPPELAGIESMLGLFVNTLPVRVHVPKHSHLRDWLCILQERQSELVQHEHGSLVEIHGWSLIPAGVPLFESLFVFENYPVDQALQLPKELSLLEVRAFETVDLPLALTAAPGAELRLRMQYARSRFDRTTVLRLAGYLKTLLENMVSSPDLELEELDLLCKEERHQVLLEWSGNCAAASFEPVQEVFARCADREPDSVAVEWTGAALTYGELETRANRLARYLIDRGVRRETVVGVLLERTPDLVVSLLAVLKAGGVYLPLDPELPVARLAFLVDDGGVEVLVSRSGLVQVPQRPKHVVLLDQDEEAVASQDASVPEVRSRSGDLAYQIYTSGTTGLPKAVMVEHGNLSWILSASGERFGWREGERMPCLAAASFDIFLFELLSPLLRGGTSVLFPLRPAPDVQLLMDELERCTAVHAVPALMRTLVDEAIRHGGVDAIRAVFVGGDVVAADLLADMARAFPRARRWVLYGPTEGAILSTSYEVLGREASRPLLGRPLPGAVVEVLDGEGRVMPIGIAGEIHLSGLGVSRGYRRRPELTAERYVAGPQGRRYRTGDLGRWQWDGNLEFLGRSDDQVKVRGFRIEPGEVEAGLRRCPGVRDAVVVARQESQGYGRLVAYLVASGSDELPAEDEMRQILRRFLPEYMVPSAFVRIAELPLTPHGKVDRRRLPSPEMAVAGSEPARRTPVEEILAHIWSEVLRVQSIGRNDRFFDLGGHSLLAIQVVSRLRAAFGVDLPLRALFDAPTVAGLAEAVERLLHTGQRDASPLIPVSRSGALPLSFAQQRLWFLDQLDPGGSLYNVPSALRLVGELDLLVLEECFTELARRHESLRTTIGRLGEEPVQVIAASSTVPLPLIDLSGLVGPERVSEARRLAAEEAWRPFDLSHGPLMREAVLRLGERDHVLLVILHHIISDGWSMEILIRETALLYSALSQNRRPILPDLPFQYADFAHWQRRWLQAEVLEVELAYWRQRLSGAPPNLPLPLDHPRPSVQGQHGAVYPFLISGDLAAGVENLSRREGMTAFMTLLAVFQVLLSRCSGLEDILVGTPVANRTRVEIENLIGFFVNTLVLRTNMVDARDFRDVLARVREGTLEAYAHQDLPFEKLVEELKPQRSLGHTPLFQIMFTFDRSGSVAPSLPGLDLAPWPIPCEVAKFDLTLSLTGDGTSLAGSVEYSTDLFDATTVVRLAEHFQILLAAAVTDPGARLSEVSLLSEAARSQILLEWSGAGAAERTHEGLLDLLMRRAEISPEAAAVVCEDSVLAYSDLWLRAYRLAGHLQMLGVSFDTPVGICISRSIDMVVGILGILVAGGAYLPLDAAQPPERLRSILEDAGAPVLLVQRSQAKTFDGYRGILVEIEPSDPTEVSFIPAKPPGESAAYVIYTSGSTGRPKGVVVSHSALASHALAAIRHYGLRAQDRMLQFSSPAFDVAAEEIFPTLISGGTLVLPPPELPGTIAELLRFLEQQDVTVVNFPASYWHRWVSEMEAEQLPLPSSLRLAVIGSEAVLPHRVRSWMEKVGEKITLVNAYGVTEATITTAAWRIPAGEGLSKIGSVPIGRPLAHARVYILDGAFQPVPLGVSGELFIGGGGVARGYLGRCGLTADRFLPDCFGAEPGARLYRTGDLGRFRTDGNLELLGRIDHQVKIRGVRVEPGEIEAVLAAHPAVRQSTVVALKRQGEMLLVAYVVPEEGALQEVRELRRSLRSQLPESMVPQEFVLLSSLPLTAGGKIDRRALPEPRRGGEGLVRRAPRTQAEELVAEIWSEVLNLDEIDVQANFFDLGGHSLLATQVLSRIRAAFQVELPLRRLFENPTIKELTSTIEEVIRITDCIEVKPLISAPRQSLLPLSFAQQRLWIIDQLEPGSPLYNLPSAYRLAGDLSFVALERSFGELVRRHESLRTRFGVVDGKPVQWIDEPAPVSLPLVDLSALPYGDREQEGRRVAELECRQPFHLAQGPLMRAAVLRLDERDHVLLLILHHIVTDGWSMGVLARDLTALYVAFSRGLPSPLPELAVQYADFSLWQRRWLQGDVLEALLVYWQRQLAEPLPVLRLPSDRRRPARPSYRGKRLTTVLEPELTTSLRSLARTERATLFMVLVAAFDIVLHYLGNTDDVVVGTNVANRTHRETEDLIGFFLNLLVLRVDLSGNPSYRALLSRVRRVTLEGYSHQGLPFDFLVDALNPRREIPDQPLFQVKIDMQNAPAPSNELSAFSLKGFDVEPGFTHNDLTLHLTELGDRLELLLLYSVDLFDEPRMAELLEDFRTVLEAVVHDPDATLERLDSLLAESRAQRAGERKQGFKDAVLRRLQRAQRRVDRPVPRKDGQL
ncbi:MAG TPA: non-ribosomal peptide synthase/polyketide synthase [Thermoanaerobaculia bacterium]